MFSQKKIVRGNDASFMNKELGKAIYTRSRLRNRYFKNPTKENETSYKKQRNKCVSLRRKSITQHFSKITSKGIMTNKQFWKTMKPFLTNKGCLENNDIILLDGEEMITNDRILAKRFNEHYINIVERSSDFKPSKMLFSLNNCITSCTFPENARVATVVPIGKKTDDKYVISNYRPVSLLNGFSKI